MILHSYASLAGRSGMEVMLTPFLDGTQVGISRLFLGYNPLYHRSILRPPQNNACERLVA